MNGLFAQIQGCFKETYSGRYLAYLLAELFRQNPKTFSKVLKEFGVEYSHEEFDQINPNGWRFPGKKWRSRGKKHERIADIAIFDARDNPRVLVEIKDADAGKKENQAQIADYLEYIAKHKEVEFLFLSRHIPADDKEGRALDTRNKRVHQKLFKDLYKALSGSDPFSQMLRKYLEDIHVTYHEQRPDAKTLEYVTLQLLGLEDARGTAKSVPEFFGVIFDDLAAIGQWVRGANKGLFRRQLRRNFYITPSHDVRRLKADIVGGDGKKAQTRSEKLEREGELGEYCNGGRVNFCLRGTLTDKRTNKAYVGLEFGIWINADKQRKRKTRVSDGGIYAYFSWKPWKGSDNDSAESAVFLSKFPDENSFQKELRKVLKEARAAGLKKCPAPEKRALGNFHIP
jgi:hypothetical protein